VELDAPSEGAISTLTSEMLSNGSEARVSFTTFRIRRVQTLRALSNSTSAISRNATEDREKCHRKIAAWVIVERHDAIGEERGPGKGEHGDPQRAISESECRRGVFDDPHNDGFDRTPTPLETVHLISRAHVEICPDTSERRGPDREEPAAGSFSSL
jgi:hypothetical protein